MYEGWNKLLAFKQTCVLFSVSGRATSALSDVIAFMVRSLLFSHRPCSHRLWRNADIELGASHQWNPEVARRGLLLYIYMLVENATQISLWLVRGSFRIGVFLLFISTRGSVKAAWAESSTQMSTVNEKLNRVEGRKRLQNRSWLLMNVTIQTSTFNLQGWSRHVRSAPGFKSSSRHSIIYVISSTIVCISIDKTHTCFCTFIMHYVVRNTQS